MIYLKVERGICIFNQWHTFPYNVRHIPRTDLMGRHRLNVHAKCNSRPDSLLFTTDSSHHKRQLSDSQTWLAEYGMYLVDIWGSLLTNPCNFPSITSGQAFRCSGQCGMAGWYLRTKAVDSVLVRGIIAPGLLSEHCMYRLGTALAQQRAICSA